MIKLVIFDLGETLIFYHGIPLNWSEYYNAAITFACDKLSIKINEKQINEAASFLYKYNTRINPRIEEYDSKTIFKDVLRVLNITHDFSNQFVKEFFAFFQRKSEPEESAIKLLSFLRNKNIKTAILTDVPYGMPKSLVMADLTPLINYIDFVLTSTDVGLRKPETAGINLLLNKFNCDAANALMVGNEKKDTETASASKVKSALLSKEKLIPDWGQTVTISKLMDLMNLI